MILGRLNNGAPASVCFLKLSYAESIFNKMLIRSDVYLFTLCGEEATD